VVGLRAVIRIDGLPIPKGNVKAFVMKSGKAMVHHASNDLKGWELRIATEAQSEREKMTSHLTSRSINWARPQIMEAPMKVMLDFVMLRPKSYPKTKWRPCTKRPDIDKLARAALDALTGIFFNDDSQVIDMTVTKRFTFPGESPGLIVRVQSMDLADEKEYWAANQVNFDVTRNESEVK